MHRLDPLSCVWEDLETSGTPPAFTAMSAVTWGCTKLVLFGGRSATTTLNDLTYVLDLPSMSWSVMGTAVEPPSARFWHSAVRAGSEMWVYGGMDQLGATEPTPGRDGGDGNVLYCLDLEADEWRRVVGRGVGPTNCNRIYGHHAVAMKSGMVVLGGHCNDQVYTFDFEQCVWRVVGSVGDKLPLRVFQAAAAVPERELVVLNGGQWRKQSRSFDDSYFLRLENTEGQPEATG